MIVEGITLVPSRVWSSPDRDLFVYPCKQEGERVSWHVHARGEVAKRLVVAGVAEPLTFAATTKEMTLPALRTMLAEVLGEVRLVRRPVYTAVGTYHGLKRLSIERENGSWFVHRGDVWTSPAYATRHEACRAISSGKIAELYDRSQTSVYTSSGDYDR